MKASDCSDCRWCDWAWCEYTGNPCLLIHKPRMYMAGPMGYKTGEWRRRCSDFELKKIYRMIEVERGTI